MSIFGNIINTILPPRCIKCGKILESVDGLCADCFNELTFISKPYCSKCGMPFHQEVTGKKMLCAGCIKDKKRVFRYARSSLEYDDVSKPLILSFKFFDRTEYNKVFAKWLKLAGKDIFDDGVDLIIPIPLHYTRLLKRRYNQSALLAKELSKLTEIKVDYGSVVRHKKTKPQIHFSGTARHRNVKDAFMVKNPINIKNKRIVLIDDVMTTGSTLTECAKTMLASGAKSVDFLTIARVDL